MTEGSQGEIWSAPCLIRHRVELPGFLKVD
jgi:hypothetical protein